VWNRSISSNRYSNGIDAEVVALTFNHTHTLRSKEFMVYILGGFYYTVMIQQPYGYVVLFRSVQR
ncbi:MAG: hypothetical protein JWM68_2440, partial [Verrucomicrobiales bacterium]|nr:hypothetical protein [Verrucomicrobiales bacterium]